MSLEKRLEGQREFDAPATDPVVPPSENLPEPPKDAYESVSRRFTWRSSLFMALGLWLVLMFTVSECAVAKSRRDSQDAAPPDQLRKETTPPTTEKK